MHSSWCPAENLRTLAASLVIVAGQAAVDGLAEQRDQVVTDVAASTAFLEIVGGDGRKVQGVIQFSEGQGPASEVMVAPWNSSRILGLNWSRRRAFPPSPIGCLQSRYVIYLK